MSSSSRPSQHPLRKLMERRIVILDGAMGTTIRTYGMKEADIRGTRFADSKKDLLNNGDLFSLTQPKMVGDIHRRFLEAGASGPDALLQARQHQAVGADHPGLDGPQDADLRMAGDAGQPP